MMESDTDNVTPPAFATDICDVTEELRNTLMRP